MNERNLTDSIMKIWKNCGDSVRNQHDHEIMHGNSSIFTNMKENTNTVNRYVLHSMTEVI